MDESILENETPKDMVTRIAGLKGRTVNPPDAATVVVAADTLVIAPDGSVLGKPSGDEQAIEMLMKLQGKTHQVYTGYYLRRGNKEIQGAVVSLVSFRGLTIDQVTSYVATGEGRDKAGSYAAQGIGQFLIVGIQGSYSNVVGLPAAHIIAELELLLEASYPNFLK